MTRDFILICCFLLVINFLSSKGDDACTPNPCKNGGKCITQLNLYGFSCACPKGFTGTICDRPSSGDNSIIVGGYVPDNSGGNRIPNPNNPGGGGNSNPFGKPSDNTNFGGNRPPNFPSGNNQPPFNPGNNNPGGSINIGNNKPPFPNSNNNFGGSINIGGNSGGNIPGGSINFGNNKPNSINFGRVDPCYPNPCYNNGVCQPAFQKPYTCKCRGNYGGDRCQFEIRRKSFLGYILGTVLPFLVIVALIGLCVYCCCIRKRSSANNNNTGFMSLPVFSNRQPKPQETYTAAPINMQDPDAVFRVNSAQPPPPAYETLYIPEQRPLNK